MFVCGGKCVIWWWGVVPATVVVGLFGVVWLRGFVVVVSFRPVSASSLRVLLRF